jgi:hypothetical protein
MQPLNLVYSVKAMSSISDVFSAPPSSAMAELAIVATKGVEELREVAANKIKYMLEQKNRLLIDLDVHAPTICFPKSKSCAKVTDE